MCLCACVSLRLSLGIYVRARPDGASGSQHAIELCNDRSYNWMKLLLRRSLWLDVACFQRCVTIEYTGLNRLFAGYWLSMLIPLALVHMSDKGYYRLVFLDGVLNKPM